MDRGSATAELAIALPAAVVVLALLLWGVAAAGAQLRCIDAARAAARAAARGEDTAAAAALARAIAPAGAHVVVRRGQDLVTVDVAATVRPPGTVLSQIGGFSTRATAISATEPE